MAWGELRRASLAPVVIGFLAAHFLGGAAFAAAPSIAATPSSGREQAIACMTSAILYEAGFEPRAGQEAVAEVILNRLRNPAFPKTVCGVIFQGSQRRTGCQFSFTCDGSLRKVLPSDAVSRAREVASRAIDGQLTPRTAGATHYHADYVLPYWAPTLVRVTAIGRHIFYRQTGASSFSNVARYGALGEQMPAKLNGDAVSTDAPQAPVKKTEPEKFMPWGLAAGPVQPKL